MKPEPVVLSQISLTSAASALVCINTFARYDIVVKSCLDVADVLVQLRDMQASTDGFSVVIVDAQGVDGMNAVSVLRSRYTNLGIVAIASSTHEACIIDLLHRGADTYCLETASPQMLLAIVLRLQWRLKMARQDMPAENRSAAPRQVAWQLTDQGWALRCPDGQSITLTTGERAFLSALLNAPRQQAPHGQLIDAVNAAYYAKQTRNPRMHLGVMISRLRRKFSQAGVVLPLKSIHGWGYMFGVRCDDSLL